MVVLFETAYTPRRRGLIGQFPSYGACLSRSFEQLRFSSKHPYSNARSSPLSGGWRSSSSTIS